MVEDSAAGQPAGSRVGSLFGPYRLIRLLGSTYYQDPVFRERLFREAWTAGRLREPHVVPIHGCGEIGGQVYLDMRLVRGADLESVL